MKPGDLEYQALVEKKRAEIRGNVSNVKMTEAETAKEIADVQGGAKSSFETPVIPERGIVTIHTVGNLEDGEKISLTVLSKKRGWPKGKPRGHRKPKGS